ncbi:hypothetical protein CRG98_018765 [Punica granatum]|uniref:Uncharacterized protein n=1 Tax=Punica granatum TaxID=22663 RepID=A0A2I0JX01_PUNGR|nr:hypothetical protein CRG98_018765 [Punica granatum]
MVLVVLGCVQAGFRGAVYLSADRASREPLKEGVCKCSGVPRLKQEASEMRSERFLLLFRSLCPHVRTFAPGCQVMSSSLSLGPTFLSLEPVDQNGVLTAAPLWLHARLEDSFIPPSWVCGRNRASARTCHDMVAWLRGGDYEVVDERPEPAKLCMQG